MALVFPQSDTALGEQVTIKWVCRFHLAGQSSWFWISIYQVATEYEKSEVRKFVAQIKGFDVQEFYSATES